MLQSETTAEQDGQSESFIIDAPLHETGQFSSEFGTFSMKDTEDRHQENAGT
ncbi:hypothetical protein [Tritonibacter scottomollicae]|uniref:hypothetical protein n=1 Tax=Tritonibacter scottomollicae TaxID=483013 RepID=UPI003AA876B9